MASRKFQTVPPYNGKNDGQVIQALQDVISYITAQAQPAILPLATGTVPAMTGAETLAQTITKVNDVITRQNLVIAKVNEIVARLQGTT